MQVYRDIASLPKIDSSVVTIGSFDGVHLAHQSLLERVAQRSREIGGEGYVITFEPHPRILLGKADGLKLLSLSSEKVEQLSEFGVENLLILPFTHELSRMDYSTFIRTVLLDRLSMREMVVGFNHRLGSDSGNSSALERMEDNFVVNIVERIENHHEKISSTHIRDLIDSGDFNRAVELLAHPYLIHGEVVDGGVVVEDTYKLMPQSGLYQGVVDGENRELRVESNRILRADNKPIFNSKVEIVQLMINADNANN